MNRMNPNIFIGIDGGGTHSTAVAAWPDGRIAAVTEGGGLNYHNSGVETVRTRLEAMARDLSSMAQSPVAEACVGMSALDLPADETTTALFTGGFLPGSSWICSLTHTWRSWALPRATPA